MLFTASRARSRSPHVGISIFPGAMHSVSGAVDCGPPIGSQALMHLSTASESSLVQPYAAPASTGAETLGRGDVATGVGPRAPSPETATAAAPKASATFARASCTR